MKYLKDCPEPGMGTWYFEIDSDGVAYRQIVILPVGTKVKGYIEAFFPHGTLIHIFQHNAVGLADTHSYAEKTPSEWMYPRHEVTAIVQGYDEQNQWVILEQIQVFKNQLTG